ncbi:hypothetical protein BDZ45DRAFT_734544 [Acephala macrosclerotiorum]|nr:hypothetical protein BDZ45DRAFT_734544 [Acephala macrosclerotiorum]
MGNISSYTACNNYTSANIAVQGIFFDEATSSTTNDSISYMKNVTTFAKTSLGPGRQHISLNPGVVVDPAYFDMADTVNIFENSWSEFDITALRRCHGTCWQNQPINLTDANIGGLLVTTQDSYNEVSALWPQFCDSLAWKIVKKGMPARLQKER